MTVNSHSGRDRSSGALGQLLAQVEQRARRRPAPGTATRRTWYVEVEGRVVGELGRHDAQRCARRRVGASRGIATSARSSVSRSRFVVGRVVEDREVAEVGAERGVLLDRPHDRFGVRHPHVRLVACTPTAGCACA